MRRTPLAVGLAGVALMAAPAPAVAHTSGPTTREAVAIADRFAERWTSPLPNHCAGGRATITRSNAAVDREVVAAGGLAMLGFADGWVEDGVGGWRWDFTRCTWTTRADLSREDRCAVDAHEMTHYVIGPVHVGPLDPRHPGPVECYTHNDRSPAQTRRSIRYRRTVARVKARAIMRRIHQSSR